jgi:hypothetical protein
MASVATRPMHVSALANMANCFNRMSFSFEMLA